MGFNNRTIDKCSCDFLINQLSAPPKIPSPPPLFLLDDPTLTISNNIENDLNNLFKTLKPLNRQQLKSNPLLFESFANSNNLRCKNILSNLNKIQLLNHQQPHVKFFSNKTSSLSSITSISKASRSTEILQLIQNPYVLVALILVSLLIVFVLISIVIVCKSNRKSMSGRKTVDDCEKYVNSTNILSFMCNSKSKNTSNSSISSKSSSTFETSPSPLSTTPLSSSPKSNSNNNSNNLMFNPTNDQCFNPEADLSQISKAFLNTLSRQLVFANSQNGLNKQTNLLAAAALSQNLANFIPQLVQNVCNSSSFDPNDLDRQQQQQQQQQLIIQKQQQQFMKTLNRVNHHHHHQQQSMYPINNNNNNLMPNSCGSSSPSSSISFISTSPTSESSLKNSSESNQLILNNNNASRFAVTNNTNCRQLKFSQTQQMQMATSFRPFNQLPNRPDNPLFIRQNSDQVPPNHYYESIGDVSQYYFDVDDTRLTVAPPNHSVHKPISRFPNSSHQSNNNLQPHLNYFDTNQYPNNDSFMNHSMTMQHSQMNQSANQSNNFYLKSLLV